MDESTRTGYLLQVVFTMIAFIVNAVQAVLHMDRPNEFIAILMFMCGQQFHQFALCLPGQVLIDRSLDLIDDIYSSKWYQTPVKFQRTLQIMQIRCSKACKLTAGGFYEMNMENFGAIIKTSVSYFTVLLSLRG
ncbi:odorant receptor coreceptor-like [Megachile rotundata]|uniref:odorant receptor coreceptor-like n=1 Tax=Megachile rotundata TaxID=143995 RepID=UPI003FD41A0A